MIYVRRDPAQIPEKIFKVAERAQHQLEALPPDERSGFIKKKSHIWRAFARYLARMSYGKCWYSESDDPQSFFDVDHFRPKAEATREDGTKDGGYPWLAFSWENFRFSAQRSNRLSKDEDTEEVVGKGSWFPLMDGSPIACWDDRCVDDERPILLDPTLRPDVDLVDVNANGQICPSMTCIGSALLRLERSIELYGLNLPNLVGARKRVMREVNDLHANLTDLIVAGNTNPDAADALPVNRLIEQLRRSTLPDSPFTKAARAQIRLLPGALDICAQPEDAPAAA